MKNGDGRLVVKSFWRENHNPLGLLFLYLSSPKGSSWFSRLALREGAQ